MKNRSEQVEYIRSAELARLTGVSTDTLRHYERLGLIVKPKRSVNGYREYSINTVERVRLVRSALLAGFTLRELSRILKVRDQGGAPCRQVLALASTKLDQVEALLIQITAMRDRLRTIVKEWNSRLEKVSKNERAGLLESLATKGFSIEGRSSIPLSNLINRKNGGKKRRP